MENLWIYICQLSDWYGVGVLGQKPNPTRRVLWLWCLSILSMHVISFIWVDKKNWDHPEEYNLQFVLYPWPEIKISYGRTCWNVGHILALSNFHSCVLSVFRMGTIWQSNVSRQWQSAKLKSPEFLALSVGEYPGESNDLCGRVLSSCVDPSHAWLHTEKRHSPLTHEYLISIIIKAWRI